MNLLKPHSIEEYIVWMLRTGEKKTTQLLNEVQLAKKKLTKQGFYLALRKLKEEEIVVVYKKRVSLSSAWILRMQDWMDTVGRQYTVGAKSFSIISLADKESISYTFSNSRNLDTFWGHAQNLILHHTLPSDPIFSYDSHYWIYLARESLEKKLLQEMVKLKRQFLMTVGGSTPLDKLIRADFKSDYLQYNIDKVFDRSDYYSTIIGDFIIEVTLDPILVNRIEELYASHTSVTKDLSQELAVLLDKKGENKLKISHNKKRAQILRKKFEKNFYVLQAL